MQRTPIQATIQLKGMKPNSLRAPLLTLVALWVFLAVFVWTTADRLPERVATHFGDAGQPNDWMTRSGHVQFLLGMAVGVPVFLHVVFALIRASGGVGCNIPNRDFWLAPERRAETLAYVQRHVAWFLCLFVSFFAGVHYFVLDANSRQPPTLSGSLLGLVAGGFLVAIALWLVPLIMRFARIPKSSP